MTLTPCTCGRRPELTSRAQHGINILRVECECGNHGASVFYVKPEDADRTRQATADGWNLSM